jgi:hypothetical protein
MRFTRSCSFTSRPTDRKLDEVRERKGSRHGRTQSRDQGPMTVALTRNVWIHEGLEDEGAARKPIHPVGESPTRGVAQLAAVVLSGV